MAHDRDHRRTRHLGVFRIVLGDEAFLDVGFGNPLRDVAEIGDDQLGRVGVQQIVHADHLALLHQVFDDIGSPFGHADREVLDRDGFRNDDFALNLVALATGRGAALLLTLAGAADRGERPLPVLVALGHGLDGQLAGRAATVLAALARDRRCLGSAAALALDAAAHAFERGFHVLGFVLGGIAGLVLGRVTARRRRLGVRIGDVGGVGNDRFARCRLGRCALAVFGLGGAAGLFIGLALLLFLKIALLGLGALVALLGFLLFLGVAFGGLGARALDGALAGDQFFLGQAQLACLGGQCGFLSALGTALGGGRCVLGSGHALALHLHHDGFRPPTGEALLHGTRTAAK